MNHAANSPVATGHGRIGKMVRSGTLVIDGSIKE